MKMSPKPSEASSSYRPISLLSILANLLWKLKKSLTPTYFFIIRSYLTERFFRISQGPSFSSYFSVRAGVPQGSILAPLLYTVFTADIPRHPHTLLASKAILSSHKDLNIASLYPHDHLTSVGKWLAKGRIKINPPKSYPQETFLSSCFPEQNPLIHYYNRRIGLTESLTVVWNF